MTVLANTCTQGRNIIFESILVVVWCLCRKQFILKMVNIIVLFKVLLIPSSSFNQVDGYFESCPIINYWGT